jgi:uncharacterized protein YcnI
MTVGAIAGLAIAATAAAHVEVEAEGDAVAGQPARLTFVVPNERADDATMTIEIQMPQDVDLADVVPGAVEGWTITTTTRGGDIVDTIRWDTTGPGLVGDESLELPVAVGPLPAVELLTFPTVQTYFDGTVVRWIEPAPPGEPEPELPVPTLAITPAPPGATTPPTEPAATAPTEPAATTEPTTEPTSQTTDAVVVATSPTDTATVTAATAIDAPSTSVETDDADDDGGGSDVWPWVIGGIIVVLMIGGAAIAFARRRTSG